MTKKLIKPITQLQGSAGNDLFYNTSAREAIIGGDGLDKLIIEDGSKGAVINLARGIMTDASGNRETVSGIEIVIGTTLDDRMSGSAETDYLVGGDGNDRIDGGGGSDEIYGGTGNDTINGGDGSDYIVGGAGEDRINGGKGFDLLDYSDEGGSFGLSINLLKSRGVDSYGNTDVISSVEAIRGTDLADLIIGNGVDNWFRGGAGNDTLDGGSGNDALWGGVGDDQIIGGTGNDSIAGGRGDDRLDGGRGSDTLDYANDEGWRGVSVNMATGVAEDSWGSIDRFTAFENVTGTAFNDWIMGDKNANLIDGAGGDDVLTGGVGADTFVFQEGHGHDQINDFAKGDSLDLRGLNFSSIEDVIAASSGHDLGTVIATGADSSITLVDVNIASIADYNYLF